MDRLKRSWKRIPKAIRQSLVLIIGGVVIAAGLVMLITPGPGWAALFLGFAIWATEFAFAEKVRDRMIHFLKRLVGRGQAAWRKLARKFKSDSKKDQSGPKDPNRPSSTPRR